ncbi:hypothetical protein ACFFLM_24705 [Deinococcus oregonensis]|uniref:Uncharacterized protein n=1 Tax=Deinococcus oregonensis TaxID=1805970 RepID=A0ABV6B9T3_9DEIO
MTDEQLLDVLGQRLICTVRDSSIDALDGALNGKYRHIYAQELRRRHDKLDKQAHTFIQDLIPYVVDDVLITILQVLDAELAKRDEDREFELSVRSGAGHWVNPSALSDGLDAEFQGQDGWIDRFSQQRRDRLSQEVNAQLGY